MADSTEKAKKQVKSEGSGGHSDDNVPISAMNRGKKKVEHSDDDDDVPLAASRAKKKSADGKKGGVKGNAVPSKVKKEEIEDSKENTKKKVKKDTSKGKENQDKSSSGNVKKEKVKKVYDLPGQKHATPEERDPLRIFYETLYDQVPGSEMAAFWMMERGLLPEDKAKKVFEKKKQKGVSSPAKPTSENKLPASNTSVKRSLDASNTKKGKTGTSKDSSAKGKKRKQDSDSEEDSDDDFIDAPKPNPRKKHKVSN